MNNKRKPRLTTHMIGILRILNECKRMDPSNLIPSALIALCRLGYVHVGKNASLTEKGKIRAHFVDSSIIGASWRETAYKRACKVCGGKGPHTGFGHPYM